MKRLRRGLVTALTLAAIAAFDSSRALAHHSFAMYDQSIKYVFTGVVERINQRSRRAVLAAGDEVVVYVKPWRAAQVKGVAPPAPAVPPASSEPVQPGLQASAPARSFSSGGAR